MVMRLLFFLAAVSGTSAASFRAYSLREAEARVGSGSAQSPELTGLGGITRPLGFVYDPAARDLILIGRAEEAAPCLSLDDLVVCLRALLAHAQAPELDMRTVPQTSSTGRLVVIYRGGIQGTPLGRLFAACDLRLKLFLLGMETMGSISPPSYWDLVLADLRARGVYSIGSTKFWLYPREADISWRDGVCVITRLAVGVQAQVTTLDGDTILGARDELGNQFASRLAGVWETLARRYPQDFGLLEGAFRLVAVARGVKQMNLQDAWCFGSVPTPSSSAKRRPKSRCAGASVRFWSTGGSSRPAWKAAFSPRALTWRLHGGDVAALRSVVLASRPAADSLVWKVPIEAWPEGDRPVTLSDGVAPPSLPPGTPASRVLGSWRAAPSWQSASRDPFLSLTGSAPTSPGAVGGSPLRSWSVEKSLAGFSLAERFGLSRSSDLLKSVLQFDTSLSRGNSAADRSAWTRTNDQELMRTIQRQRSLEWKQQMWLDKINRQSGFPTGMWVDPIKKQPR